MCVDIELLVRRKYWQQLLYATDQQPNAVLEIGTTFTFTVSQLIAPVLTKYPEKRSNFSCKLRQCWSFPTEAEDHSRNTIWLCEPATHDEQLRRHHALSDALRIYRLDHVGSCLQLLVHLKTHFCICCCCLFIFFTGTYPSIFLGGVAIGH